ncbi:hypothetical protein EG328_000326 [Venturia inaequalis]|uniref:Uncharacterized protein n=1 Tax=Venturia inaequalis TaxID=5025 RepID=A0A8H3V3I7_VENIN|nr:hypothetical protein EG328_000326 [Venturia inaequalis]
MTSIHLNYQFLCLWHSDEEGFASKLLMVKQARGPTNIDVNFEENNAIENQRNGLQRFGYTGLCRPSASFFVSESKQSHFATLRFGMIADAIMLSPVAIRPDQS